MKSIIAADLFCGSGGTSTGLAQACAEAGVGLKLTALNHWDRAVETHSANHPDAAHLCAALESVEPTKAVPGGKLDLLIASPSCTHHSTARGGKPMDDQDRASGWHVVRWAEALGPRVIVVENVREWLNWGPLDSRNRRPLASKRGATFVAWVKALESLGYRVSWRVLNAADYGEATTRERLFVVAVKGRAAWAWPEPTHAREASADMFGSRERWRAAREVIDWTLKGASIHGRKKPLSANTLKRIEAGLRKFGGEAFLQHLTHSGRVHDAACPVPTVTGANRGELALVEPFTVQFKGTAGDQLPSTARSVGIPLGSLTTGGSFGVCEPFIASLSQTGSNGGRVRPTSEPAVTITTAHDLALVEPFLLGQQSGATPRAVGGPTPTIAAGGAIALVQPFLLSQHTKDPPTSADAPVPAVTCRCGTAVVEPYLVSYYGTGGPRPTGEPLGTVTTKDRFGLVEGVGLDILFRMLQPHELSAAMGFPSGYKFSGNKSEVVRQIGNAVSVRTAKALSGEAIRFLLSRRAAA